jgi:peroxiredoxin
MAYGAADDPKAGYAKRQTFVISPEGKIEQAIDTKDPAGQADALLKTV